MFEMAVSEEQENTSNPHRREIGNHVRNRRSIQRGQLQDLLALVEAFVRIGQQILVTADTVKQKCLKGTISLLYTSYSYWQHRDTERRERLFFGKRCGSSSGRPPPLDVWRSGPLPAGGPPTKRYDKVLQQLLLQRRRRLAPIVRPHPPAAAAASRTTMRPRARRLALSFPGAPSPCCWVASRTTRPSARFGPK